MNVKCLVLLAVACIFFGVASLHIVPLHGGVAKYWETIVEKLKSDGWQVRWTEAMHDGASGWTATAVRGKERHSTHANDITLAFQELEASCNPLPKCPGEPHRVNTDEGC